jgi:hypothetical protein
VARSRFAYWKRRNATVSAQMTNKRAKARASVPLIERN